MIKNILSSVALLLLLSSCSNKNNIKISGDIKEADKQNVYLEQVNVDNTILIDSTRTDRNGHFTLKTATSLPTFYNIKVGQKEIITFLAEPNDHIELSGTLNDLSHNYWVDGSENSLWIKLLNFQLNNTQIAMDSLKKNYAAIPTEPLFDEQRQKIATQWDSVINKQINFSKDFILKHAISPASYYALYQKLDNNNYILTPDQDLHSYKIVASSLKAMYPESQYTKAILKHLDQINKNIQNQKIIQLIANSESSLPEIRLPNAQGDTIALSSMKGKFIILDFTVLNTKDGASYISDLQKVYNNFRNKGVQIYQVCLDENQSAWQQLVSRYGINWTCVRDGDALQSRAAKSWNLQNVPANYIINSKSEIVGKNLNGRRLEERLNDLLK
ncbi:MAG: TlpA disulfide reductase family protein [Odoribacter sp.]